MKPILFLLFLAAAMLGDDFYYRNNMKVALSPLAQNRALDESGIRYYRDGTGRTLGVDANLLFKIENGADADAILADYNLTLVKNLGYGLYVAKGEGSDQTLAIANRLYQDDRVRFAHPDFHMERESR